MEKKLILVLDECYLGVWTPSRNTFELLHGSILKGATVTEGVIPFNYKAKRLATLTDFNEFRVHEGGFLEDETYEFFRYTRDELDKLAKEREEFDNHDDDCSIQEIEEMEEYYIMQAEVNNLKWFDA